ncbi:Nup133 N terminal like-domain-containing protein [Chlamydoabsidia padenii]|nr:Nup133 N terminal like-domain-containing protein [Chlamydoabsidia padenii]
MINSSSSEIIVEAINKASDTLEQVARLDKGFPDIGDTFKAYSSGEYTICQNGPVEPIITRFTFLATPDLLGLMEQRKPSSPAGIFSEINRAYLAVDKRLMLWNYNNSQEPTTYDDTHDIISVAIVKPKPNVFSKDITHVLIIATTQDIKIIALAYKCDDNLVDSITFYNSGIKTFSDGIRFTSIMGTNIGRVFMTGSDGNVWELVYKSDEGWFTSQCYKMNHTGDRMKLFFGGIHDPCVSIALSNDGHVLYQLTQRSTIKVSYLGRNGQEFTTVASGTGIGEKAKHMCINSPLINNNNNFTITSIHPTLPNESKHYQLVAVTSNGCRLYFSHFKHDSTIPFDGTPNGIELVHVRTPPPMATSTQPTSISKSFYNNGVFMLANSYNGIETLTLSCPDIGYMARKGGRCGFHEMYNSKAIEGNIISISEITTSPFHLDELASSTPFNTPRLFLVFTTTGIILLLKQRPLEMLQNLLMASGLDIHRRATDFDAFIEHFGATQVSSLCFRIIGHADSVIPNGLELLWNDQYSIDKGKGASDLLNKYGHHPSSQESQSTCFHDGLALYLYRVIGCIWTRPIIKEVPISTNQHQYQSTTNRQHLLTIQQVLRRLRHYLDSESSSSIDPQSSSRTPHIQELYQLISLLAQAISLVIHLFDADFNDLLKKFDPKIHSRLKSLTYKELLTTRDGRIISRNFTQALVDRHLKKYDNADSIVNALKKNCGFFVEELVYKP